MRAGALGESRAGVRDLDHRHRALAPAGDANLVAAGIAGVPALERLQRIAHEVEHDAEELFGDRHPPPARARPR